MLELVRSAERTARQACARLPYRDDVAILKEHGRGNTKQAESGNTCSCSHTHGSAVHHSRPGHPRHTPRGRVHVRHAQFERGARIPPRHLRRHFTSVELLRQLHGNHRQLQRPVRSALSAVAPRTRRESAAWRGSQRHRTVEPAPQRSLPQRRPQNRRRILRRRGPNCRSQRRGAKLPRRTHDPGHRLSTFPIRRVHHHPVARGRSHVRAGVTDLRR